MDISNTEEIRKIRGKLNEARSDIIALNGIYASNGEYDAAQQLLGWARSLDEIESGLSQVGTSASVQFRTSDVHAASSHFPHPLPYYYVEGDKLVKVGKSKQYGKEVYYHRVTKRKFDIIIDKLAEIASTSSNFWTQDLVRQCKNGTRRIPSHEPQIVVSVLIERGLITRLSRGLNAFVNPKDFEVSTTRIWHGLPKQ